MITVIVYGPQRSGKTSNAQALCEMYGCKGVNDGGSVQRPFQVKYGYLNLVNDLPDNVPSQCVVDGCKVVSIYEALEELKRGDV